MVADTCDTYSREDVAERAVPPARSSTGRTRVQDALVQFGSIQKVGFLHHRRFG
jgi:hypothetical protein